MIRNTLALAAIVAAAGAANATLFSFASDNGNHRAFTFQGFGNNVTHAPQNDPTVLYYDDNNGPLPQVGLSTRFEAAFTINFLFSVPLGGGNFVHNYALTGNGGNGPDFGWYDWTTGAPILTAKIERGASAKTAIGPAFGWGSTATLQGADGQSNGVTYTWHLADVPAYGLYQGQSIGADDFAFTLSWLQTQAGLGVALESNDGSPNFKLPSNEWRSEGSFSGSANFIPTPGALALVGLAGLTAGRRRR